MSSPSLSYLDEKSLANVSRRLAVQSRDWHADHEDRAPEACERLISGAFYSLLFLIFIFFVRRQGDKLFLLSVSPSLPRSDHGCRW